MRKPHSLKSNTSGQLLIVAALAIAIIISSTTMYVYELTNYTNESNGQPIVDLALAIKQSTRNAMISSLANVSNGGLNTTLAADLNSLLTSIRNTQQFGLCTLRFTLQNDSTYASGIRLLRGNGSGISSSRANFTLTVDSSTGELTMPYSINITSSITVNGYYSTVEGNQKRVNLTIAVFNDGTPALAKNITVYYNNTGSWAQVNGSNEPSLTDYGTGTYRLGFTVVASENPVEVWVRVQDYRNVFVSAEEACFSG